MDRAISDGVALQYEVRGEGEPVILIHPGIFVDWLRHWSANRFLRPATGSSATTASAVVAAAAWPVA